MIGLALLAPLSSFAEENGANKKKPNIIYILADDLGLSLIHISEPTRPY